MARDVPPAVQWAQYLAARLAAAGLLSFDVEDNLRTAATIGRGLYRLFPALSRWPVLGSVRMFSSFSQRRDRARGHVRLAFPDLDDREIDRIALCSFEHLIQLIIEVCHTPRLIHEDSWSYRVRLGEIGPTLQLLNSDQPVIMVTGHLGNWEVLGYLLTVVGYRVHAIARPLDNQRINDWLLGVRERKGLRVVTKWNATDGMLEILKTDGLLAFIADQNAGDKGLFVPFFGRLASAYKSIGLLAITQNIPIICGYAKRLPHGYHFELGAADIIYPQDWSNQPDPLYYVTARYTRAIEQMVRACPEQYLWMHRRWKSRPRFERQGKPMPSLMRRKLESLPWMDQAMMNRLLEPGT